LKSWKEALKKAILSSNKKVPPQRIPLIILIALIVSTLGLDVAVTPNKKSVRIHFIAVGYGDAALVELPDAAVIMIDAGPGSAAPNIIAYLDSLKVSAIDIAVITHPHKNHFDGFISIMEKYDVGRMYINGDQRGEEGYNELIQLLKEKNIPVEILKRGDHLNGLPKDVSVEILNPPDLQSSVNGNAIVSWLKYKDTSVLFLSDIMEKNQRELIEAYPEINSSDCISVPHHGVSLSEEFIEHFVNKVFIVSTGPSEFGKVDEKALKRLNGRIYRTDILGTLILESDGKTIKVR